MSSDVAAFLLGLLARQTLGAADEDLVQVAQVCERARLELEAVVRGEPSAGAST